MMHRDKKQSKKSFSLPRFPEAKKNEFYGAQCKHLEGHLKNAIPDDLISIFSA